MGDININTPEYQELFIEEMKELIDFIENDIISFEVNQSKEIKENIKRNLHTLKGNFKIYGNNIYVDKIHKIETSFNENKNKNIISDILSLVSDIREEYGIEDTKIKENIIAGDEKYKIMIDFQGKDFPEIDIEEFTNTLAIAGDIKNVEYMSDVIPVFNKYEPHKLFIKIYIEIENTKKEYVEEVLLKYIDSKNYKIVGKKDKVEKDKKTLNKENKQKNKQKNNEMEEKNNEFIDENKIEDKIIENEEMNENVEQNIQEKIVSDIKKGISTIRVNTLKLDNLVNIAGELIVSHSRLKVFSEYVDSNYLEEFTKIITDLDNITKELQENVLSVRMIPVGNTFLQFKRMVRDISKQLNKKVNFEIYGGETEIDKTIIEKIIDPLRHMIRNSIDHGIEDNEEDRIKKGKNLEGIIKLNAFYQGGEVIIEVFDDGKGLDKNKILEKAISKNIINSEDKLNDEDIYSLIFTAGFSTKTEVTEISGRGVGMDVVKNNIESIGGKIEIESKQGFFTCFKIRLPLTLAIIDGMLVRVGENIYIIPILSIVESVQPKEEQIKQVKGKKDIIDIRGEYFALIKLYKIFKIDKSEIDPTKATILIVETYRGKAAIMVDEVLDIQQIVIKKLGIKNKEADKFSGATILGNGEVALILDLKNIHDSLYEE